MKLGMNTVGLYIIQTSYHLVVSSTDDDRLTLSMVKKNPHTTYQTLEKHAFIVMVNLCGT